MCRTKSPLRGKGDIHHLDELCLIGFIQLRQRDLYGCHGAIRAQHLPYIFRDKFQHAVIGRQLADEGRNHHTVGKAIGLIAGLVIDIHCRRGILNVSVACVARRSQSREGDDRSPGQSVQRAVVRILCTEFGNRCDICHSRKRVGGRIHIACITSKIGDGLHRRGICESERREIVNRFAVGFGAIKCIIDFSALRRTTDGDRLRRIVCASRRRERGRGNRRRSCTHKFVETGLAIGNISIDR